MKPLESRLLLGAVGVMGGWSVDAIVGVWQDMVGVGWNWRKHEEI
jgi:hypothetical protein